MCVCVFVCVCVCVCVCLCVCVCVCVCVYFSFCFNAMALVAKFVTLRIGLIMLIEIVVYQTLVSIELFSLSDF